VDTRGGNYNYRGGSPVIRGTDARAGPTECLQ
jgi:hypothetical protein